MMKIIMEDKVNKREILSNCATMYCIATESLINSSVTFMRNADIINDFVLEFIKQHSRAIEREFNNRFLSKPHKEEIIVRYGMDDKDIYKYYEDSLASSDLENTIINGYCQIVCEIWYREYKEDISYNF